MITRKQSKQFDNLSLLPGLQLWWERCANIVLHNAIKDCKMCINGISLSFIPNIFIVSSFFGQCCCSRIRWYLLIFPNVISLRLRYGNAMRNRSIWNYGSWNIEDFLKSKDMNTFASFRMLWIKVVHCQLPIIGKCNEIQLNYSSSKTKKVVIRL